jgi:AraC-like DNA-binding protein
MQKKSLHLAANHKFPLVCGGEALRLGNFLTKLGVWIPRLFHRISAVPIEAAEERVSGELLVEALEAAMRAIRQPSLPVKFASTVRTLDMGIYGAAIQTAANVADALERSVRLFPLMDTTNRVYLEKDKESVRWVFRSSEPERLGVRIRNEIILAEHVAILRFIAPGAQPTRITFSHAEPSDSASHRQFFSCPILWAVNENSVEWSAQLMSLNLGVDRSLDEFIRREADRRLALLPLNGSLDEISNTILRRLPLGDADLITVSRLLGRSARTLRRELGNLGFTFRELRDMVRQRRATEMNSSGKYSQMEVAVSLGFSEASAFSRAQRRWNKTIKI